MKQAACTIVSLNYLPYARVLAQSFITHHPGMEFYVLLVDRVPGDMDLAGEQFTVVCVEDLGIPEFKSIAFKYDILELNTNVKPTFLKYLLKQGIDQIVYLDPDILIYHKLDPVFDALQLHPIVLIPHCLSPAQDGGASDLILLGGGVFNLGFVGVSNTSEGERFLSWWEERCLHLAFNEPRAFMFVDQKWANLVPCYFESSAILRHEGCNVAYWNLHEREISQSKTNWVVNGQRPLIFYHFSGISVDGGDRISKFTDSVNLSNRPDLRPLFEEYRALLLSCGFRELNERPYAFGVFDNGQFINRLTRSLYAANIDEFRGEDPFSSASRFYAYAKSLGVFSRRESAKRYSSKSINAGDRRVRAVNLFLRLALRILGADRYTMLMKYLSWASILRNQRSVLEK